MLQFPASTLIRFFHNHGFLGLNTQHQWYTVVGGSKTYRNILIKEFKDKISTSNGAISVKRISDKVYVTSENGETREFDKVIFASHADEALNLLSDPTDIEIELLSPFKYQQNTATLHTDSSVMPKLKRAWSSWNYRIENINGKLKTTTIYYMNSLQGVSEKVDYFVSIDDPGKVNERNILKTINYTHPLFSVDAINAQKKLNKINEQENNTYFCGSYFKYGFHEDAYTSALNLSNILLKEKNNELVSI
jgi:predicted NAD/FAD-binding protein